MPKWFVQLQGHPFDLDELTYLFTGPNLQVIKVQDSYYLKSSKFDDFTDANKVNEYSQSILIPTLNGAVKVYSKDYREVAINSVTGKTDDGSFKHHVYISSEVTSRSHFKAVASTINTEGTIVESQEPTVMNRWEPILLENKLVSDALRLYNSGPQNWGTLYKVLEIIKSDVGSKKINNWIPEPEKKRFTHTANSREAIGDDARHGSQNQLPPKKPMTIQEATYLIRSLIYQWIGEKVDSI